jgi:hypothetical protein
MTLADELIRWNPENDPERNELMKKKAPIGGSTLRAIRNRRYFPGPLLERAIRAVIAENPPKKAERAKAVG